MVTDLDHVAAVVAKARERGETVALANGAFDLLHVGHVRYLKAASELADWLVVAVNSDASVRRLKGQGRPVMPQEERAEMVAAIHGVDWVIIFDHDTVTPVIERLHPDVHAKGTDYTPDSVPEREVVRAYGGRVVIAGDAKDHSSSAIFSRLKS